MLRTDTGNFNRFLTSLGLLLLAAALLIPYFYFHDTDVLRVTQQELKGLTQTGRDAIQARQGRAANLEVWILVLSGALMVGGIACLFFGGKRLRHAQTKEDEAIDRQAKRDDVEIQRLSEEEVEKKRDEQALEATEENAAEDVATARGGAQVQPRQAETVPQRMQTAMAENRAAIARIEEAVRAVFEDSQQESFDFISEARLVSNQQQLQIDGLFRAKKSDDSDVLLELRIVRQARALQFRARQYSDAALALLTRYKVLTGRRAMAWLLIVVPGDVDEFPLDDRRRLEDRTDSWLVGEGKLMVIREEEISKLPALFERVLQR